MPEIKNTFLKGRMNKDLDERLIPSGEYRDALNIEISTSEDSNVGSVQTILGNIEMAGLPETCVCVGSYADEKTNKIYWFVKEDNFDAILEYDSSTETHEYVFVDTKKNTDSPVLRFPNRIITGINLIDDLLFWTDGFGEPKKINITRCKQGTTNRNTHTRLIVDSVDLGDIEEENITVIKKKPTKAPTIKTILDSAQYEIDKPNLFEKTFSRFSYRYKYADGEYSAFGPFSNVVFNPEYIDNTHQLDEETGNFTSYNSENSYTTKEPFNATMINKITSIEIYDFVAPDMPKDVIEIELLYKQENSPIIYSVAKLPKKDDFNDYWNLNGYNQDTSIVNSEYKGKYIINTENIYAALPENQFIRVFDTVPKKALAQEITGNRIVYGNYTHNYDLKKDRNNLDLLPTNITVDYEDRINDITFQDSPLKSLKTLRNYQVGVIYGDKYGRETPVFTSNYAATKVNWKTNGLLNASRSLSLCASHNNNFPDWADYFKFYVKETSTEHYNLIMDKAYSPTSAEDLNLNSNPDHVWISFFSSDRNKIDIDTYLILKKIVKKQIQITENNKFKVIDIKNEPPDSIKFDYFNLLNASNNASADLDSLFIDNSILDDVDTLTLDSSVYYDTFEGGTLPNFSYVEKAKSYYIYWEVDGQRSKRYKIRDIRVSANSNITLKLSEKINVDDSLIAVGTSSSVLDSTTKLFIDRKDTRDLDQFSGRFFVKIVFDYLIDNIQDLKVILLSEFTSQASNEIRWWSNEVSGTHGDQTSKIVNHLGSSSTASVSAIGNTTFGTGITNTAAQWDSLEANHTGFFIDQMYFCAGQVSAQNSLAKYAVDIIRGMSGADTDGGTSYYYASWSEDLLTPLVHPASSNPLGSRNFVGGANGMTNPITKNFYPFIFNYNHLIQNGYTISSTFATDLGPSGSPLGSNKGIWRWSPFDKDVDSSNGYNIHGRFNANSGGLENDSNFIGNINYNLNVGGNYAEHLLPKTHPFTDTPVSFTEITNRISLGNISGIIDINSIVNGLDGIITSTTEHTIGSRVWRSDNVSDLTNGTGIGSFVKDNTYGDANDEGKIYMHLSFLAPGKNLVPDNLDLSSATITGNSCIGAYLQGIHGGGIFTKSAKDVIDNGSVFDNNNDFESSRIIECERSSNNNSTLDIGYDPAYKNLHDTQWDPTENSSLTPAEVLQIKNFIESLQAPNAKFKFSGDTNSTVYTIKSVKVKYLYNHTPWKRRYIVDPSYNSAQQTFSDQYGLNQNMIPGTDSVEEAAVNWAKELENNAAAATIGPKILALENKIKDFAKPSNRRTVYILELDKDPTNETYNPLDGSNITSSQAAIVNKIEFLTNVRSNNTSLISSNPAIWETEPKENKELEIYYEASDAIPTEINEKNRELYAPIGCKVEVIGRPDASPGVDVFLSSWSTHTDGRPTITLSQPLNATDSNGNSIVYARDPQYDSDGNLLLGGVNSDFKFIRKDGSYTILRMSAGPELLDQPASGPVNFIVDPTVNYGTKYGLSWFNSFSFGNGIESNRIRDDFNQMIINNGARASVVLEEPYAEENRKNGLIYSGIYNSTSNINNLNQFIIGEKITKDLNPTYGSIQKLFQRRISLVAFCQDKVVSIVSNKDSLFNADGKPQLISSTNVLGDATPFVGDYGISNDPASFASESYRAYFTDKQRGAVLRLSMDGLTPISEFGMHDWFRDNLIPANALIGSYDAYSQDYNVTLVNDDTYYNLIENSYLDTGEESVITQGDQIAENEDFSSTSPTTYPFPLQYSNTRDGSMFSNQFLETKVNIIEHEPIAVGQFQAYNNSGASNPGSGQPGDPGTSATPFTPPTFTPAYLSGPHFQWQFDNLGDRNIFNKLTDEPAVLTIGLGNQVDPTDSTLQHGGYGKRYINSSGRGYSNTLYPSGIKSTSYSTTATVSAFDYLCDSISSGGLSLDGNIFTNNQTSEIIFAAKSSSFDDRDKTTNFNWSSSSITLRPRPNYPSATSNTTQTVNPSSVFTQATTAHDLSVFAGEIVEVDIGYSYLRNIGQANPFSYNGQNPASNYMVPNTRQPHKIILTLTDDGSPIDSLLDTTVNTTPQIFPGVWTSNSTTGEFIGQPSYNGVINHNTYSANYYRNENRFGTCRVKVYWHFLPSDPALELNFEKVVDTLRLKIKFDPTINNNATAGGLSNSDRFTIRNISVKKTTALTTLGIPPQQGTSAVPATPAIPSVAVPGWTRVEYYKQNWLFDGTDGNNISGLSISPVAQTTYGTSVNLNNLLTTEGDFTWYADGSNGTLNYQTNYNTNEVFQVAQTPTAAAANAMTTAANVHQQISYISSGNPPLVVDDRIDYNSSSSATPLTITKAIGITDNLEVGNYYLLDIAVSSFTSGASDEIYLEGILDPNNTDFTDGLVEGDQYFPIGHLGVIKGAGTSQVGLRLVQRDRRYGLFGNFYYHSNNHDTVYRAIFQLHKDSAIATSNPPVLSQLPIKIGNANVQIEDITLINITNAGVQTPNNTILVNSTPVFQSVSAGELTNYTPFHIGYSHRSHIFHLLSTPVQYVKNNAVNFNCAQQQVYVDQDASYVVNMGTSAEAVENINNSSHSRFLLQRFSASTSPPFAENRRTTPQPTFAGYELEFEIGNEFYTNSFDGKALLRVAFGIDDPASASPNYFGVEVQDIDAVGVYKAVFNFDHVDPFPNGQTLSIDKPAGSSATIQHATRSTANSNFGYYDNGCIYFQPINSSSNPFVGSIKSISITDLTEYITPGSTNNWVFSGFNSTYESDIVWSNGSIVLDTENKISTTVIDDNVRFYQNLNKDILEGTYRLKFSYTFLKLPINNKILTIVYTNSEGKGLYVPFELTAAEFSSLVINQQYEFEIEVPIGVLDTDRRNILDVQNNIVFYPTLADELNMSIDNITLKRIIVISQNKTLSFSEDVKGWTSFKSFTPEFGLSLSKKYYTFKNGSLYEHNKNSVINNFYGSQYDSSITTILNENPSVIKSFKTLGYEGTQSKVNKYKEQVVTDINGNNVTITDIENYNLTDKSGWYVDHISTDKKEGFVPDFIEKEGKWFNYIKGTVKNENLTTEYISKNTEDLSFQGVGMIESVTAVVSSPQATPAATTPTTTTTTPITTPTITPVTTPVTTPSGGSGGSSGGSGGTY